MLSKAINRKQIPKTFSVNIKKIIKKEEKNLIVFEPKMLRTELTRYH